MKDLLRRLDRLEGVELAPRLDIRPEPLPDDLIDVEDPDGPETLVVVSGVPEVDFSAPRAVHPRFTETVDMDTAVSSSHEPDAPPATQQDAGRQEPEEPERVRHSLAPQVHVRPAADSFIVQTGVDGAETVPLLTWVRR